MLHVGVVRGAGLSVVDIAGETARGSAAQSVDSTCRGVRLAR